MTFTYTYRDRTGALKSAVLEAASRSDCFSQLSAKGISPVSVVQGGTKITKSPPQHNRPSQKLRVVFLLVGIVVIAGLVWLALLPERAKPREKSEKPAVTNVVKPKPNKQKSDMPKKSSVTEKTVEKPAAKKALRELKSGETNATPIARRQVWGTESRMEAARARGSRRIFKYDSEAYLGMYAQPGEPVPPTPFDARMEEELLKALEEPVVIDMNNDTADIVQFKNIVQGMKEELKEYLKNGGTVKEYLAALDERQQKESNFRSEAYRSVSEACEKEGAEAAYQLWKKVNQHLESQGINPVAKPALLRRKYGRGIDDYREDAAPINQN